MHPFRPLVSLLALAALAFAPGCVAPTDTQPVAATPAPKSVPVAKPAPPRPPTPPTPPPEPTTAYLFAHFIGENPGGEQVYFSVSEDGLKWTDLNNSAPVLVSTLGDKGVRDPSLVRSPDGKKFYLLATDLCIGNGKGWDAARFHGSTSLVFWESTDLVNWSQPWMVDVASSIPGGSCAWAPEAIYDEKAGAYFVYWATISPRDGVREARVYGSHTKDFRSFSPAQLYIERAGEGDIIDTQIIEVKGHKHRYYRASRDTQITIEGADSILGTWERIGDLAHLGYTGRQVEGPILFQFNQQQKWGLLVDQYAAARGYLPLAATNLDDPRGFQVLPANSYSFGASRKRHGGVLNITASELAALRAKWPSQRTVRLASLAQPDRVLRHYDFQVRADRDVRPPEDALWRLVPGLAGGADSVSLRAVNFPDHHIVLVAGGVAVAANDGRSDYAARATFRRVPGLSDSSGVSFRLAGESERYLLLQDGNLIYSAISSEAERRRATFLVRE
jgi:hypothetical protein